MDGPHGGLQQETVLWEGVLRRQQYGELTAEVTFPQPVLITAVSATDAATSDEPQLPQLFRGYARDLSVPTASRFVPLFSSVIAAQQGQEEEYAVDKVLPAQHVFIRGRCINAKVQLLGYTLRDAALQIKETAEARLCPLPDACPMLSLPSMQQQSNEQGMWLHSSDAAPSLTRPASRLLPLRKIPPAFVLALAPLAKQWDSVRVIPLPPGSAEPTEQDLLVCEELAQAVLAAHRGSAAVLSDKLSSYINPYNLVLDWDGIRDSVLDMATYCCSALADPRVTAPVDVSLATTGVCAAILLAACQDGAAQFLSWPLGNVGVPGAIAVKELVSIRNQPPAWQSLSLGLVDLLLESCPAIACPTLQGTLDPAGVNDTQDGDAMAVDSRADSQHNSPANTPRSAGHQAAPAAAASVEGAAGAQQADGKCNSDGGVQEPDDAQGAGGGSDGLPASKRQRVGETHAGAPAGSAAGCDGAEGDADGDIDGLDAAAAAPGDLAHAGSCTGAAAAAATVAAAERSGLPSAAVQDRDAAMLAGQMRTTEVQSDDAEPCGLDPPAKRHRSSSGDGLSHLLDSEPDDEQDVSAQGGAADDALTHEFEQLDVEAAEGVDQQQDGGTAGREQPEVVLQEGDYPEADEDAIRAEAAAKALRRGVVRRPPVCALVQGQLYAAIVQLAATPLHDGAAFSCKSVLRRLRAYQCLDVLQSTIGPMLAGQVNALLLQPPEFCAYVSKVAAAASDLATLILQPAHSRHNLLLHDKQDLQAATSSMQQQQLQEADYAVLQLMLSFRTFDLLAAICSWLGVHLSRLQQHQHQQQDDQPTLLQQAVQTNLAMQQLCNTRAQLLAAFHGLLASLAASAGGWCFLSAARDGLAALAAAVCPTKQVFVDGGPFDPDTSLPYDPQHGWQAERHQLLQRASGLTGPSSPSQPGQLLDTEQGTAADATAGDLADSLQRMWLLVEAVRELEGAEGVLTGRSRGADAADKLSAALKTLYVVGFASDAGQELLVSAVSASPSAVRQLGLLLDHCGKMQAAAADEQDCRGHRPSRPRKRSREAPQQPTLVYAALYAPDILWVIISSPRADALAAWLPHTEHLHKVVQQQLNEHDLYGKVAAKAAFPDVLDSDSNVLQRSGLPSAVLPGGAAAAEAGINQVLLQLHGAMLTATKLQEAWKQSESASCAKTGAVLLRWLREQLPELVSAAGDTAAATAQPQGDAPVVLEPAAAAAVAAAAAASLPEFDGAAAAAGAQPPAGKDVKSTAVVEFMQQAACRSAALCALHLINMLLRGAPQSIRTMARRAADRPRDVKARHQAFNTDFVLNPDGSLGLHGAPGCMDGAHQSLDAPLLEDGFAARELLSELLLSTFVDGRTRQTQTLMVLEVLDQALRTATVALRASDADLVWSIRSGSQQDLLAVLQTRTATALLMRAACTTTASLLLQLTEADPEQLGRYNVTACSLLDALICAHSTVVTSKEGLQACVPHPVLGPLVARATDPGLNPVQRLAADAALASASVRCAGGRVQMLLEARQALAVCLRCWQLQGWWPDPVGALLGHFPRFTEATAEFAQQQEEARQEGDPHAPPAPAPRQGPRQRLSSLLGLADLCPEEWPPRGASQVAARDRDAAQATKLEGSPFVCPNLILLRQRVADALGTHWERLEDLIAFGAACSTRMARLALVRMLARMSGLGAGMSVLLGPQILLGLCRRLADIRQCSKGLAERLLDAKDLAAADQEKQQLINEEVNTLLLQVQGATNVTEVLLPLCGAPSIKSVLTEQRAAGMLSKAVYAVVRPLPDLTALAADEARGAKAAQQQGGAQPAAGPGLVRLSAESQVLAGSLLQLIKVLMDPDISMNPWADSRELQDTPSVLTGSATVAWLLLAAPYLSPANMAVVAQLLVGQGCAAVAEHCLTDSPKGRATLLRAGRQWQLLKQAVQEAEEREERARVASMASPPPQQQQQQPQAAGDPTPAELQAAAKCLAASLDSAVCAAGGDTETTHAASCAAIARVLRELSDSSNSHDVVAVLEVEQQHVLQGAQERFTAAAEAAVAAEQPARCDSQAISTLLCSATLLLACDAATLDFWKASAAAAQRAATCPPPQICYPHNAARSNACASSWWPKQRLVGEAQPRSRSVPVQQVVAVAEAEEQRRRQRLGAGLGEATDEAAGVAAIPVILAPRSKFLHSDSTAGQGKNKASLHVDEFQKRTAKRATGPKAKAPPPPPPPPPATRFPGPSAFPGPPQEPGATRHMGGGGPPPRNPGSVVGRGGPAQQQQQPTSCPPPLQLGQKPLDPRLHLLARQGSGLTSPRHGASPGTPLSPTVAAMLPSVARSPGPTPSGAAAAAALTPSVPVRAGSRSSDSGDRLLGGLGQEDEESPGGGGMQVDQADSGAGGDEDSEGGEDNPLEDDPLADLAFCLDDPEKDELQDLARFAAGDPEYDVTEAGGL